MTTTPDTPVNDALSTDGRLLTFDFRAVRPTFDLYPFRLNGQPADDGKTVRLWAQDQEGFLTMQATATLV